MSHNSTAKVDQKEYLKKYLSGEKSKKKKKKKDKGKEKEKKKSANTKRSRVIDDDVTAFRNDDNSEDEVLLYDDDAPQIVGEYLDTNNGEPGSKWRSIANKEEKHAKKEQLNDEDDGRRGKRAKVKDEKPTKVKREITPDMSPPRKRNHSKQKANHGSMDRKRKGGESSDQSPKRGRRLKVESPIRSRKNGASPNQETRASTDLSPPRRQQVVQSPPKRQRHQADVSPVRKRKNSPSPRRRHSSIDQSPQRQRPMGRPSRDQSPVRQHRSSMSPQRLNRFGDQSPPPRRGRRGSLDQSPQRRRQFSSPNRRNPSFSPSRRGRNAPNDRSCSPPNRKRQNFGNFSPKQRQTEFSRNNERRSPSRFRQQRSRSFERSRNSAWNSASTQQQQQQQQQRQNNYKNPFSQQNRFPPHHNDHNSPERRRQMSPPPRRRGGDDFFRNNPNNERNRRQFWNKKSNESFEHREMSDQSPAPSQSRRRNNRSPWKETRRASSTDHRSPTPPARTAIIHWETAAEVAERKARENANATNSNANSSPPPTHKPKAAKTLDGKKAGLQDARALKEETSARRKDEEKMYAQMPSELSGRDADVQVRNTGRRGRRARDAKEEDPEKVREKEERERKRKEKYDRWGKGVKQVEDHRAKLAEQEYESSKPLARYADDEDLDRHLREKERADDPMLDYMRRKKKDKDKKSSKSKVPVYEGSHPENRFGIRPGHRWDGVDRSNGYEKKWFDVQSNKRAAQEDAYKYSVEDM